MHYEAFFDGEQWHTTYSAPGVERTSVSCGGSERDHRRDAEQRNAELKRRAREVRLENRLCGVRHV